MEFEWNDGKRHGNDLKHGVSFEFATLFLCKIALLVNQTDR